MYIQYIVPGLSGIMSVPFHLTQIPSNCQLQSTSPTRISGNPTPHSHLEVCCTVREPSSHDWFLISQTMQTSSPTMHNCGYQLGPQYSGGRDEMLGATQFRSSFGLTQTWAKREYEGLPSLKVALEGPVLDDDGVSGSSVR